MFCYLSDVNPWEHYYQVLFPVFVLYLQFYDKFSQINEKFACVGQSAEEQVLYKWY